MVRLAVSVVVQRMRMPHALVPVHMVPLFRCIVLHQRLLMNCTPGYDPSNNASAVIVHMVIQLFSYCVRKLTVSPV